MELENMFAEQKWNILSTLAAGKQSPLQLSEKLDTSMANVSQQLRLLEATNLVQKEKIKNRDKGKPRTLFSLTGDHAYLISAMNSFADKKLLQMNDHHKAILRIWFLQDTDLQFALEKLYWKLQNVLEKVEALAINETKREAVIVTADEKAIKTATKGQSLPIKIIEKTTALGLNAAERQHLTSLYDSARLIRGGGDA